MTLINVNNSTLMTYARILMTAPAGATVRGVTEQFHELEEMIPDGGEMAMQSLQYESYRVLSADGCAMELAGTASAELSAALHGAGVLEEVREGTACMMPTGETTYLPCLPRDLLERWWGELTESDVMEDLLFETMGCVMEFTHNFPLALETVQYLVTYRLATAMEKLKRHYPRKETERCVKLAKYAIPWERPRSTAYIGCVKGEVFLLDGDIDDGSCEDYLEAICQAERAVSHEDLKRYLCDRTAQPCFDFELEKAVRLWLGGEYKLRGRPVAQAEDLA